MGKRKQRTESDGNSGASGTSGSDVAVKVEEVLDLNDKPLQTSYSSEKPSASSESTKKKRRGEEHSTSQQNFASATKDLHSDHYNARGVSGHINYPVQPEGHGANSQDYITDEERKYFRAIKEDLNGHLSKAAEKEGVASMNEAPDYMMVWDRLESREVALCQDKELSFVVENLLRLTGEAGAQRLMDVIVTKTRDEPTLVEKLCSHFSASHVIETLLDCAVQVDNSSSPRFRKSLRKFVKVLLTRPPLFLENNFASHVAERLVLSLCGVKSYTMEDGGLILSFHNHGSDAVSTVRCAKDDSTSRKMTEAFKRLKPIVDESSVVSVLQSFQNLFLAEVKPKHWGKRLVQLAATEAGSVLIQALCVIRPVVLDCLENLPESIHIYGSKSGDSPDDSPSVIKALSDVFLDLAKDKCGSRVAEILVASCSTETFEDILLKLYGDSTALTTIIQHPYAHHSLVKSIEFSTEVTQLVTTTHALKDQFPVVVQSGHGMILVKLAKKLADENAKKAACGRHGSAAEWSECQTMFVEGLRDVYLHITIDGWTEELKKSNFVVLVGALYPKNLLPEVRGTARKMSMPGSQVLQAISSFKDSSAVYKELLKIDKMVLLEICCSSSGAFLVETVLAVHRSRKGFYQPFVKRLLELVPELVTSKAGSRVFDFLWKTVDLKQREEIAAILLPKENELRTNQFGRFLLSKLNLGLFRRSIDVWRKEQQRFQNQKDDLKNILDMLNKTK